MKAESPEANRPMTLKLDQTTTPLRASFCAPNGSTLGNVAAAAAATASASAVPAYMRHRTSIASDSVCVIISLCLVQIYSC